MFLEKGEWISFRWICYEIHKSENWSILNFYSSIHCSGVLTVIHLNGSELLIRAKDILSFRLIHYHSDWLVSSVTGYSDISGKITFSVGLNVKSFGLGWNFEFGTISILVQFKKLVHKNNSRLDGLNAVQNILDEVGNIERVNDRVGWPWWVSERINNLLRLSVR